MTFRRMYPGVGAAVALLFVPLAALGATGSVTTAPINGSAAPTLGWPMLVLLGVLLFVSAVYAMRRASARAISVFVLVAATTGLVAVSHAGGSFNLIVNDGACGHQTIQSFNPADFGFLQNQCPNPIRVISVIIDCGTNDIPETRNPPTPLCTEGLTLESFEQCHFTQCV